MLTVEDRLARMVAEDQERIRKRRKARYQLARSLGFTAPEARHLASHSEATIRALAEERAGQAEHE